MYVRNYFLIFIGILNIETNLIDHTLIFFKIKIYYINY